jgi:toxin FitB
LNLVDSCGWVEYFSDGPNSGYFGPAIENFPRLIVPSICCYEVYKKIEQQRGKMLALEAIAYMRRGTLVDLTPGLAIEAAQISKTHQVPLADSIILATARRWKARIWTQDADFKGLPDVKYFQRK